MCLDLLSVALNLCVLLVRLDFVSELIVGLCGVICMYLVFYLTLLGFGFGCELRLVFGFV